jgi:ABC-2 type transport system ATP-binding protein
MSERKCTIETRNLTKVFGKYTAVNNITMSVYAGEVFGFLGANGAGKTTAIRMLCGLLSPTSGTGTVANFDIIRQTERIRTRIGYMSQKFSLYSDLTIMENLHLYGSLYGLAGKKLKERIDAMAQFLSLTELLPKQTGSLPWGWQQRLALACANLHQPDILFLDEPTGSVDPVNRRNFWDLIQILARQGTTVFVSTHHMDEAENCHRISIMVDGKIAEMGTPGQLRERYAGDTLHQAFITLVEQYRKKD